MKKQISKEFKFSIIAGRLKGKTIIAPDLGITRPPLSRLRKAIFDFLAPYLNGSHYLDLFSGTGSYLFEAVSRGAERAVGIEFDGRLAKAINSQANKFDVQDKLYCVCGDVFNQLEVLEKEERKFDLIMIAPPQYKEMISKTLNLLHRTNLCKNDSIILCQHGTSETKDIGFEGFSLDQKRKYGNTTFTILRPLI